MTIKEVTLKQNELVEKTTDSISNTTHTENCCSIHVIEGKKVKMKYGKCSECSCPGFYGSGYTCQRNGCGHHYDSHW